MQSLTAPPRDAFTAAQITALLTGPQLEVDFGVERVDQTISVLADLSSSVESVTVSRDCNAAVHGTVALQITQALPWGQAMIRPYMLLSNATIGPVRFNQGVYMLTTPSTDAGETPQTYSVTGFDQLHLLDNPLGDSYTVPAAANVLNAVNSALGLAGVGAPIYLDSTAASATLPVAKTWPLASGTSPTWYQIINDLLAAIGYGALWCDWDGAFRAGPFVPATVRPSEWVFNVGDLQVGLVAQNRSLQNDVWGIPNQWVFIQNGITGLPVEGVSKYTVNNTVNGPSSQTSVGRVVGSAPQFFDAVDFTSLKVQGDAVVAKAMQQAAVIPTTIAPFPIAWHLDIATLNDPVLGLLTVQGASWSLPFDGTDMSVTWSSVT